MEDHNEPEAETAEGVEAPESDAPGPDESQDSAGEQGQDSAVDESAQGADAGDEAPKGEAAGESAPEIEPEAPPEEPKPDPLVTAFGQLFQQQQRQLDLLTQLVSQQKQPAPDPGQANEQKPLGYAEKAALKALQARDEASFKSFPQHVQSRVLEALHAAEDARLQAVLEPGRYFSDVVEPRLKPALSEVERRVEERLRPFEQDRRVRAYQDAMAAVGTSDLGQAETQKFLAFAGELQNSGLSPRDQVAFAYARAKAEAGREGLVKEKAKLAATKRQIDANLAARKSGAVRTPGGGDKGKFDKPLKKGESTVDYARRLAKAIKSGEISESQLRELGG